MFLYWFVLFIVMTKDNFELLRTMIRKTLDNTHRKDVLDYFKKGKITEKERDELLDYLKMIDGIFVIEKGVKKNKLEFKGYGEQSGWKIHLYVDPKNYQYVFRWLFLNGPYDFKHLYGGEHSDGSDFTIYIGNWDDMFDFAGVLEKEIGNRLMRFDPTVNKTDMCIYPHVAARFQVSSKIQSPSYTSSSKKFYMYGWSGASFLWDDINELCEVHGFSKGNVSEFVYSKLWAWYKKILAIRAYKELGKIFGDYFLGKRRPNLLTETFDKLEKKYGSELPKPGRPCVADIANLTEIGFPYEDFPVVGNVLIQNKSFLRIEMLQPNTLGKTAWGAFLSALPVLMSTELASLLKNKDGVKAVLVQIKDVVDNRGIGLIAFIPSLLAWYLVELNTGRKPSSTRVKYLYEWYNLQHKQTKKPPSFKEVCEYAKKAA